MLDKLVCPTILLVCPARVIGESGLMQSFRCACIHFVVSFDSCDVHVALCIFIFQCLSIDCLAIVFHVSFRFNGRGAGQ